MANLMSLLFGDLFRSEGQQGGGGQPASFTNIPGGGQLGSIESQDPQQQDLRSQLLSLLSGQLGGQGQGQGQDPIAEQARTDFNERGLPELLERFTAGGSSLRESGTRDAILRAQTGLESQLAGGKYQMLQNLLGTALTPTKQQFHVPAKKGLFGGLLENLGGATSAAAPFFAAKYALGKGGLG